MNREKFFYSLNKFQSGTNTENPQGHSTKIMVTLTFVIVYKLLYF